MDSEPIKTDIDSAFQEPVRNSDSKPQAGTGNPGLPVASLIFAIVSVVLFLVVGWHVSILAGIVAIVLGVLAHKQASPNLGLAKAGIIVAVLCIVFAITLVGIVIYQLSRLGIS